MAEDSGQERTEQPTARRKQQAREKGQVASSRELNTMLMMMVAGLGLLFYGPIASEGLGKLFKSHLVIERENVFDVTALTRLFDAAIMDAVWILAPFFVLMTLAAMAGPILMGGGSFNGEALGFKWDKLNPVTGLKRVFALKGLVELVKALIKFIIIVVVSMAFLYNKVDSYLSLGNEPLNQALQHTGVLLVYAFLAIASALILIALVDVPFQLWDYQQQLRMTFQEIKDENKDTEGNPDVRGRVRRVQREIAQRRMMAEVPKADVIVTNPEHYSVALKYDQSKMAAPVVVAKGTDLIAMQIRTVAREHNVPILEAPPLARALHHTTKLNAEIPAGLYLAVAQVLAYVFKLRTQASTYKNSHHKMDDLPIPDDMQFDS